MKVLFQGERTEGKKSTCYKGVGGLGSDVVGSPPPDPKGLWEEERR